MIRLMGDRVLYKDQAVEPFSQSLQDDLTGQVNLKFQYPMTKTFTAIVPYRFAKLAVPAILPFGTNADGSFVWNFEFGSL